MKRPMNLKDAYRFEDYVAKVFSEAGFQVEQNM